MKPTEPLITFLVRCTITLPETVALTGCCYLLMGRYIGDLL